MKKVFKQPYFLTGFLFIAILITASICHAIFFGGHVPQIEALYNSSGTLVSTPPFSPSVVPPFGTDSTGTNLFIQLLKGAKFTIGIAVIVAFLRIFFSLIIGLFYRQFLMRFNKYLAWIIDAFHYVPISLIVYFLLAGVLFSKGFAMTFTYSFNQRVLFEFLILAIIAIPTLSLYIGNEAEQIHKNEFIQSVRLLGGSKTYIVRKHIFPLLLPKLIISFFEQIVQTLILLVHLGLFHLLFGGTHVILSMTKDLSKYMSVSGEWSGLIGNSYQYIFISPWIPMAPLIAFALTILALNLMLKGLRSSLSSAQTRKNKKKALQENAGERAFTEEEFEFVKEA